MMQGKKSNFPKEPTYVENLVDLTGLRYIIVGHLRNQFGPELRLYENGIIENTKTHEQFYGFSNRMYFHVNRTHVHKLVAENFLITVKRPDQTYIDHIDGNMQNNNVTNLRFCSQKENMANKIARKRMSESHIGNEPGNKGKCAYTNGNINVYANDCPAGFYPGWTRRKHG